jgi:hypothetical protein
MVIATPSRQVIGGMQSFPNAASIAITNGIPPGDVLNRKIVSAVLRWIEAHHGCELFLRRFHGRYQKRIHMYMNFDACPLIHGIIAVGRDLR